MALCSGSGFVQRQRPCQLYQPWPLKKVNRWLLTSQTDALAGSGRRCYQNIRLHRTQLTCLTGSGRFWRHGLDQLCTATGATL